MELRSKLVLICYLIFSTLTMSCQGKKYDDLDFSKSNVLILKKEIKDNKIKSVELIFTVKEINHIVKRVENIQAINIFFSDNSKNNFQTSGQQSYAPSEEVWEFQGESKIVKLDLVNKCYLLMKIDFLNINLKDVNEIICDFIFNSKENEGGLKLLKSPIPFRYPNKG